MTKYTYKYCPSCKTDLITKTIEASPVRVCPDNECQFVFWNNPLPVVGAIVETHDGIILARNKAWKKEIYSIITGFVNAHETPEIAVKRECLEELGLEAKSVQFLGNYPYPEKNQIIMVFHVTATGTPTLNYELHSIKVFSRDELQNWPFGQEQLDGWPFGCGNAITDWLK